MVVVVLVVCSFLIINLDFVFKSFYNTNGSSLFTNRVFLIVIYTRLVLYIELTLEDTIDSLEEAAANELSNSILRVVDLI